MTEEPEKTLDEMEAQGKEVEQDIEGAEQQWERTQKEVPSADDDEQGPLDEDNPVGGV